MSSLGDEGRLRADLMVREAEDELLVLDPRADQVHQLNRSAALIWRLHGEGASLEEIADRLAAQFEVSAERAKEDVEETLLRFRALSLIG